METKVSTKGQVVLPGPIRSKMGLRAGDSLDASIEGGRIVLTPRKRHHLEPRIIEDPVTGIPAVTFGPDAPILTGKEVEEMLADFP